MGQHSCVAGKILKKKQAKKGVFRHFWNILTKNNAFFGARSPIKISIYWRQRQLKKNFRVRHQKWISQNSSKRNDPITPPPPILNPPLFVGIEIKTKIEYKLTQRYYRALKKHLNCLEKHITDYKL